jgi:hypothetical protein
MTLDTSRGGVRRLHSTLPNNTTGRNAHISKQIRQRSAQFQPTFSSIEDPGGAGLPFANSIKTPLAPVMFGPAHRNFRRSTRFRFAQRLRAATSRDLSNRLSVCPLRTARRLPLPRRLRDHQRTRGRKSLRRANVRGHRNQRERGENPLKQPALSRGGAKGRAVRRCGTWVTRACPSSSRRPSGRLRGGSPGPRRP